MPSSPLSRLATAIAVACLFCFSVAISMRNGLSGFSFDSDPVYYGGYMVANGWWPFIDWGSSYSVLPALIEGAFMQVLGTGWHVTVVHASLTNGLYAVLAWGLFRHFGLGWLSSLIYAGAAAVTYYAPVGFGTPDKPSFAFLMMALLLQAKAIEAATPSRVRMLYAGAALAAIACLVAKLNPSVLYVFPMLAMFLGLDASRRLSALTGGLAVVGALALLLGAVEAAHSGFLYNLYYYGLKLPLMAGAERVGNEGGFAYTKLASYTHLGAFNILYGLMAAGAGAMWLRRGSLFEPSGYRAVTLPIVLGFFFWVITVFHLSHIAQSWPAHVTLVIPGVALLHAALANTARTGTESGTQAVRLFTLALVATIAMDAKEYQRTVGKPRVFFDFNLELGETSERGAVGIDALRYLRWIRWTGVPNQEEEIRDVVTAMRSVPGNVFVLGMPNHYYAFAEKAPLLPATLIIAGHTTPPVGTPEEAALIAKFSENVVRAKVRHVVANRELADGPAKAFLQSRWVCGVTNVGRFAVLAELCGAPDPDYAHLTRILYGFVPRQDGYPSVD